MYKKLRLRLTLWYVVLSAITFAIMAVAGTGLCYESINVGMNQGIESMLADSVVLVDDTQPGTLRFRPGEENLTLQWSQARATVQLFDAKKKLVSEFGYRPGYPALCETDYAEAEFKGRHVRMGSDPIMREGHLVGFLQVQVPTAARDQSVMHFSLMLGALAPVLIIALGATGYIFSGKATEPVESAFMMLRQFLADAGHELRTPIHLIQLTAENAAVGHEGDEELQQDIDTIVRTTDRMGRLVENMMTLARMEVKQLTMRSRVIRLDLLLQDAVTEYSLRARERGISLESAEFRETTIVGDPDQLYRVVANLIENALRYTDSGGRVEVAMPEADEPNTVRFSVQDSGIGIPAASLPQIFDRFYRVDKSRSRAAGGSGLGLSIVKAICEAHNGRIAVESVEGKGSIFMVWLPLPTSTAVAAAHAAATGAFRTSQVNKASNGDP